MVYPAEHNVASKPFDEKSFGDIYSTFPGTWYTLPNIIRGHISLIPGDMVYSTKYYSGTWYTLPNIVTPAYCTPVGFPGMRRRSDGGPPIGSWGSRRPSACQTRDTGWIGQVMQPPGSCGSCRRSRGSSSEKFSLHRTLLGV